MYILKRKTTKMTRKKLFLLPPNAIIMTSSMMQVLSCGYL